MAALSDFCASGFLHCPARGEYHVHDRSGYSITYATPLSRAPDGGNRYPYDRYPNLDTNFGTDPRTADALRALADPAPRRKRSVRGMHLLPRRRDVAWAGLGVLVGCLLGARDYRLRVRGLGLGRQPELGRLRTLATPAVPVQRRPGGEHGVGVGEVPGARLAAVAGVRGLR